MGPHVTAKTDSDSKKRAKPPEPRRPLPADLAEVALLDIADVCAAVRMSSSWLHDEVRAKRFPQPLRFGPRCTRWKAADVRAWLVDRAAVAAADTETAEFVAARAKKGSNAAQAKRQAAAAAEAAA